MSVQDVIPSPCPRSCLLHPAALLGRNCVPSCAPALCPGLKSSWCCLAALIHLHQLCAELAAQRVRWLCPPSALSIASCSMLLSEAKALPQAAGNCSAGKPAVRTGDKGRPLARAGLTQAAPLGKASARPCPRHKEPLGNAPSTSGTSRFSIARVEHPVMQLGFRLPAQREAVGRK